MSDLLLKTIVEKLEALELAWKVSDDSKKESEEELTNEVGLLRIDIKNLPPQILPATSKLGELSASVNNLTQQLKVPIENWVKHKHELHKGIWIAVTLFLVIVVLTWALLTTYQNNKKYLANDIKYRYFKTYGNKTVLKLCSETDSLYQKDADSLRTLVEQEEQRLNRQAEELRLADEKEREAKTLRSKGGQH